MLFREITSLNIGKFNEECVKSRLLDSIYSSLKHVSQDICQNLSKEEVKALNNLAKNKDLVVKKTHKSSNIVILNRSDYISKLSKIFKDTSKFKRVKLRKEKL